MYTNVKNYWFFIKKYIVREKSQEPVTDGGEKVKLFIDLFHSVIACNPVY